MRRLALLCLWMLTSCVSLPAAVPLRNGENPPPSSHLSEETNPLATLEIYVPYVGQGDATLIRTAEGKTLLIDAGPPRAGREHLLPLLRSLNIQSLDALLITHYDLDHLGGVPDLLAGEDGEWGSADDLKLGGAWDRGGAPYDSSPGHTAYLEALVRSQSARHSVVLGTEWALDPSLSLRVVAVNATVDMDSETAQAIDLSPETWVEKENAASIALLLQYGNFRYLSSGDLTGGGMLNGFLTADVESILAQLVGPVDVVHVNHHGSLSSSNANFVAATSPQAILIQAGVNNAYGHPAAEVVQRWEAAGAEVFSTSEGQGYVLTSEGEGFEVRHLEKLN